MTDRFPPLIQPYSITILKLHKWFRSLENHCPTKVLVSNIKNIKKIYVYFTICRIFTLLHCISLYTFQHVKCRPFCSTHHFILSYTLKVYHASLDLTIFFHSCSMYTLLHFTSLYTFRRAKIFTLLSCTLMNTFRYAQQNTLLSCTSLYTFRHAQHTPFCTAPHCTYFPTNSKYTLLYGASLYTFRHAESIPCCTAPHNILSLTLKVYIGALHLTVYFPTG